MNKVIYHANCADGWCAAWIAAHALGLTEDDLIPASYSRPDIKFYGEIDADTTLYIVDFSFPRDTLKRLGKVVKKVVVLDHHKTAQAELEDLDGGNLEIHFDMERSGARMTYDYFAEQMRQAHSASRPKFDLVSQYVQDRDLWHWSLPDSRAVSAFLGTLPKTMKGWDPLLNPGSWDMVVPLGNAVLAHIQQQVDTMTRESKFMICEDHSDAQGPPHTDLAIVNICLAAPGSEILNVLCQGRPFAIGWAQGGDGSYYYSLRSDGGPQCIDVGSYARRMRDSGLAFAGGGHARAAGFSTMSPPQDVFTHLVPARGE